MALTVSMDTGIGMTFESGHAVIKDFHMEKRFDASGNKAFVISYKGRVLMNSSIFCSFCTMGICADCPIKED